MRGFMRHSIQLLVLFVQLFVHLAGLSLQSGQDARHALHVLLHLLLTVVVGDHGHDGTRGSRGAARRSGLCVLFVLLFVLFGWLPGGVGVSDLAVSLPRTDEQAAPLLHARDVFVGLLHARIHVVHALLDAVQLLFRSVCVKIKVNSKNKV